MKIVIDIPEEKYEWIKKNNPNADISSIVGAVANGTPYEERPHEWINREAVSNTLFPFWERYECNRCHRYNGYSNFCPNCGADMRGDKE